MFVQFQAWNEDQKLSINTKRIIWVRSEGVNEEEHSVIIVHIDGDFTEHMAVFGTVEEVSDKLNYPPEEPE